jgi:hypothetical protein
MKLVVAVCCVIMTDVAVLLLSAAPAGRGADGVNHGYGLIG